MPYAEIYRKNRELWRARSSEYYYRKKTELLPKMKEFREKNAERLRKYFREHHFEEKLQAFAAYGGRCACCGEIEPTFLSIDHINGNGRKQRREIGANNSQAFYRWLRQNNYPPEFQCLCFNCNCGRRINGGVCAHVELEENLPGNLEVNLLSSG
jgi:hypothetical protein